VRGQALCVVAGIVLAIVVADRGYRRAGGPRGVIWDVAAWAVPAGLVPAVIAQLASGAQRGVPEAVRAWILAAGFPGAVAFGVAGAWVGCHRIRMRVISEGGKLGAEARAATVVAVRVRGRGRGPRLRLGPVAGATAPGLLYGHAVAMAGQWMTQGGYGKPSSMWWAVAISPAHRAQGLENFATFQPMFAYKALSDVALGITIAWLAPRLALSGGQVLACACAGYAAAGFGVFWLGIGHSPALGGLAATALGEAVLLAAAVAYLARTWWTRAASSHLGSKGPLERSRPVM
jgi:prolipoprotein diacylglyceryltransferase